MVFLCAVACKKKKKKKRRHRLILNLGYKEYFRRLEAAKMMKINFG